MKSTKRRYAAGSGLNMLLFLLVLFLILPVGEAASEAPQYIENAWNYVDGSMDISGGIPSDATGRLGRIRNAGKLTVATSPDYPPQEFIDDTREGQARYPQYIFSPCRACL